VVGIGILAVYSPKAALWLVAVCVGLQVAASHFASRGLRRMVEDRTGELRELPYEVLRGMESETAESAEIGGRVAAIQITVEDELASSVLPGLDTSDTLRVLVRGSMHVLFSTQVSFDGFYKCRDGGVRPMHHDEFDDCD
jgi:hypothetical protein